MLSKTMLVAAAVTLTLSSGLELTADNQIMSEQKSGKRGSNKGGSGNGGSKKKKNNTDDTTDNTPDNTPDPVEPANPAVNTRQYF